ncbi:MAG: hypothetical protein DCF16_15815 [Alphaproteobacteria bacterium]|nr:MAG: hypothetical protein DCF16_15815 [Alphaproteobacteria bacterium]
MAFIERLLLREDIDALEHDLSRARARQADDDTLQMLEHEISRLKARFAALRSANDFSRAA